MRVKLEQWEILKNIEKNWCHYVKEFFYLINKQMR